MAKLEQFAERKFRNEEIEKELVAYLLRKKPMLVSKVEPKWFSTTIYENIVRIQKDTKAQISKSSLLMTLRSRNMIGKGEAKIYEDAIAELYDLHLNGMNDKSAQLNINHVIEMFEGRSIIYGIRQIANSLKSMSVPEIKNKLKELGSGAKLPEEIISGDYVASFGDRVKVIDKKRRLREEGKDVGIPTGIRVFDTMVGGLMRSEFGVIAGQPGVGKTATLVAFATYAWRQGYNVLFVSGEMPKVDVEFRMDSDIANIPAAKFRFGNLTTTEQKRWMQAIHRERDIRDSFLEVVSFPRNFTATDIEGYALQIQDQYQKEIDLICLDSINIMNAVGSKFSAKDWQAQADTVWDVKAMCADLNGGICLWTAGHVKDEAIDLDYLSLEHVKYTRAISETAPVVIGLVRSQDDEAENVLELQVLKMRNAPLPNKAIILKPNLEYMRIHEEVLPLKKDIRLIQPETKRMPTKKTRKNGNGGKR